MLQWKLTSVKKQTSVGASLKVMTVFLPSTWFGLHETEQSLVEKKYTF